MTHIYTSFWFMLIVLIADSASAIIVIRALYNLGQHRTYKQRSNERIALMISILILIATLAWMVFVWVPYVTQPH